MIVHTTRDQPECHKVLDVLQLRDLLRPEPGQVVADGIIQMDDDAWLVGTNDKGVYTLYFLDQATKPEAWAFFNSLHGGCGHINPRIRFPEGHSNPAAN